MALTGEANSNQGQQNLTVPSIALPKGGGAIRGMGEKFGASAATGTGSMSVPLPISDGRSGFGPHLELTYNSGSANGPFGFGWNITLPSITRKTDKGLPRYRDAVESDVYILAGAEDLVPVVDANGARFKDTTTAHDYTIHRYRPRIEGLFARIERWTHKTTGAVHWRSITRDNVTSHYGKDSNSRIFDPDDASHVFSWLICESYDDKGNAIVYEYAAESDANVDRAQINERNRARTTNRYPKRIKYGNRVSHRIQNDLSGAEWMFEVVFDYDEGHYEEIDLDQILSEAEQHRYVRASADSEHPWRVRPDPFSFQRPGFEVRTYRRCRRVLMFHRFAELGDEPCLVRAAEFDYADLDYTKPVSIDDELAHQGSTRFGSFIRSITQSGYVRDMTKPVLTRNGVPFVTYLKKSLPSLDLEYSKPTIQDNIRQLDPADAENLPIGIDGKTCQWVDLDGESISGVLTEQGGAWFYKHNLGNGRFGPLKTVGTKPSLATLRGARHQLLDLAGDGQLDIVAFSGPTPGFYERTDDEEWVSFRTFPQAPNILWDDPNLRFVDLDGDGHADILITEHDVFTWHASMAEEGFGPAEKVGQPSNEERGPRLIVADGTQSIYFADMSGDGLTDLVRIRNGDICYWPNVGYGRFGARVNMDDAPHFDSPDQFDQRRIRIADIDGSGTNDIIYLGRDGVRLYFNQSGNRWSAPRRLQQFPHVDDVISVMTADLLGNGTACLVWSSPLPADSQRPLRFIDLMGGTKPHLLIRTINNLGVETRLRYASSTKFYLADKAAGRPWITRLPFPVQVVERVEQYDHISRNRFVTRYAFHHGYFDGVEREFRGFGMVEQWDSEEFAALTATGDLPAGNNNDALSHVPSALTRTWFHTGVYLSRDRVSDFFAGMLGPGDRGEYYREPAWLDDDIEAKKHILTDTLLPIGLTADEEREACRAIKGAMLRQEVYALDGTGTIDYPAGHPYTVTEQSFSIGVVQKRAINRHAVFFPHAREAITYHYDRDPADPRVTHTLALEVDSWGNTLKEAAVAYGRRNTDLTLPPDDRATQAQTAITYTENGFTKAVDTSSDYRAPLSCESRTYELTGYKPGGADGRFQASDFVAADTEISYEQAATNGKQRRLIEHTRTLYRKNDLTDLLPLSSLESLAIPGESYKLAFTPGLLKQLYDDHLPDPAAVLAPHGGYVRSQVYKAKGLFPLADPDDHWWIPSGRLFLSPDPSASALQELTFAQQSFFLPRRYRDPFHTNAISTESVVAYDEYQLIIVESRDALGNVVSVQTKDDDGNTATRIDYRVLHPWWVTDSNGNRNAVVFDALGLVVGTAVMGKAPPATVEGDSLKDFIADLTELQTLAHLSSPLTNPQAILSHATSRVVYDFFAYARTKNQPDPTPPVVYGLGRETHESDPLPVAGLRIQHSFSYSDGFGREIQKKVQAETGPVPKRDGNGKIVIGVDGQPEVTANPMSPRWVGTGWMVFNNKGKPVRKYDPFFTDTHAFEFDVRIGTSEIVFYDPIGRVVATLHPNHTWDKVIFGPWRQETWDLSDTVTLDPRNDPDVKPFVLNDDGTPRLPSSEFLPLWHGLRTDPANAAKANARWPDATTRAAEKTAAEKAALYAKTPTVAHADAMGRTFLNVAHNRFKYSDSPAADPPVEQFYSTRIRFDIESNQREVIDAKARIVVRYGYDMLGNRVHRSSMEAGERWTLNDVTGQPIAAWDSRGHSFRTEYDPLRRPVRCYVTGADVANPNKELLAQRLVYGEQHPENDLRNLRGALWLHLDHAGAMSHEARDFKGNVRHTTRRLAAEYKKTVDWRAVDDDHVALPPDAEKKANVADLEAALAPFVDAETFTTRTRYDALNRIIQVIAPRSDQQGAIRNVIQSVYNEANLLERVDVWLDEPNEPAALLDPSQAPPSTAGVDNVDYDAKGQRLRIDYKNGATTQYEYERETLRLTHLQTGATQTNDLQNLHYTYDAAGNITRIRDDAQQAIYFNGQVVSPSADFTYDATFRLIEATGREHIGQANQPETTWNDEFRVHLQHPQNGQAMRNYAEAYEYDACTNLERLIHRAANGNWTRIHTYDEDSLLEPGVHKSNRLSNTRIGAGAPEPYTCDIHGNITSLPHLSSLQWDFRDQIEATAQQVANNGAPETTWYVYDARGERVRKITELASGKVKDERIYHDGFEIYRRHGINSLARETLYIMDETRRIALVEVRTAGNDGSPPTLIRYQFGNQLGSAMLELDAEARIISYEEYTPYGSTTYQAVRSQTETPKRYRYSGKERDEETGLYYHGARYYACWLGRWISCDPSGVKGGLNLYAYVEARPIIATDPTGHIFFIFIAVVVVVASLTAVSEAGAPENEEQARAVKPHISDAEFAAHTALTGVSMATGNAVTGAIKGAPILAGMAGGAVGGGIQGVGDQGIEDVKKGEVSSPKVYATAGVRGAATGAVVGGVVSATGQVLKAGYSAVRGGGAPRGGGAVPRSGGRGAGARGGGGRAAAKPPADPYDVEGWNKYYEQNPSAKRSVGAAAADDPVFKQKAPDAPKVKKLDYVPPKDPEITARPKGGTESTPHNEAALQNRGVRVANAYPRDPLHHVLPQEFRKFFEKAFRSAGLSIDDYAVSISQGEHSALHTMKWNPKWAAWIKSNPNATPGQILAFAEQVMKEFKVTAPFVKYVK
jgi:RHS repeat-associated protein